MDKFKEIRPIVLGIAIKDNKILAGEGYDKVKGETFYRCLGGGIDFLEKSDTTLKREFMEEIQANITVGDFLGICENIFNYNGKDAHELILMYSITIDESDCKDEYHIVDGEADYYAKWVDLDLIKSGKVILYPEEIKKYI